MSNQVFLHLPGFKGVKESNGARLATLHKELLPYFKSLRGFNSYAIEMLISIVQNDIFLLEAQAHQCIWASTANWRGGPGKNVEIDILQENRNRDIKKEIQEMGANKTDKAIERSSRASGGMRQTVQNFDHQVNRDVHSSSNSHRSSATDEAKVIADLSALCPIASMIQLRTYCLIH